jgi:hypothetical protein
MAKVTEGRTKFIIKSFTICTTYCDKGLQISDNEMAGHAARIGENVKAYILVDTSKIQEITWASSAQPEDNTENDAQTNYVSVRADASSSVYGSVASYCEHSAEPLGSTNLIQIS